MTDGGGEAARLIVAAARRRLAAVSQLGMADADRLTEWQLNTIRRLLAGLIRTVEDELRSGLAGRFAEHGALAASLSSGEVAIAAPIVERSAFAADPELIAHLLRRVEEHRLQRAASAGEPDTLLPALIHDADPAIAGEAMALLIAQSRRLDRFQEPVMARTELPAELQHRLVWTVAASLRLYMVERHRLDSVAADAAVAAEAAALLASYDEGDALEPRCMRLAQRLAQAGRLADDIVERAVAGGLLSFGTACLAVRAGLAFAAAAEIAADPAGRGPALLLRAVGIARPRAAAILLGLGEGGGAAVAAQLDLFDATRPDEAQGALELWRIDPEYRAALGRLLMPEAA